jgi:hypothetical protein
MGRIEKRLEKVAKQVSVFVLYIVVWRSELLKINIMIKHLITDYKKITLYGDCYLTETGHYFPFRGRCVKVKILGLFWITYRIYTI